MNLSDGNLSLIVSTLQLTVTNDIRFKILEFVIVIAKNQCQLIQRPNRSTLLNLTHPGSFQFTNRYAFLVTNYSGIYL